MVCLETTFLVDLIRGNKEVESLFNYLIDGDSVITIATPSLMELISGASNNQKRDEKKEIIEILSSVTTLPLTKESAILAGEIESELMMAGESIGSVDVMIAAIAKYNNETLITRNKKHFEKIPGLKIESY